MRTHVHFNVKPGPKHRQIRTVRYMRRIVVYYTIHNAMGACVCLCVCVCKVFVRLFSNTLCKCGLPCGFSMRACYMHACTCTQHTAPQCAPCTQHQRREIALSLLGAQNARCFFVQHFFVFVGCVCLFLVFACLYRSYRFTARMPSRQGNNPTAIFRCRCRCNGVCDV